MMLFVQPHAAILVELLFKRLKSGLILFELGFYGKIYIIDQILSTDVH